MKIYYASEIYEEYDDMSLVEFKRWSNTKYLLLSDVEKEIKDIKKQIWLRRNQRYPHLVEIDLVYKYLQNLLDKKVKG